MDDVLLISGERFNSRLFVGTGKYSSSEVMRDSLEASRSEMVTVALKRTNPSANEDSILDYIIPVVLLPLSSTLCALSLTCTTVPG